MKKYYSIEIPEDFRIFESEFGIEGIQYKRENFLSLSKKGTELTFFMKHDAKNPKDANAIAIIAKRKGFFGDVEKPIGFVPAKISSYIADTGLLNSLVIRPKRSFFDDTVIDFSFDILGPKDKYTQYKSV